jgi:hypothetical protein
MATQLSVIRGDNLGTQTVTLVSTALDFSNMACTGQVRPHPDGNLLYQFVPTITTATLGTGIVYFDIPSSVTKSLPPINLYGDIHFYGTGISDVTLFEFRLDVSLNVTHL